MTKKGFGHIPMTKSGRLSTQSVNKLIRSLLLKTQKQTNEVFACGRGNAALRLSVWVYPNAVLAVLASTKRIATSLRSSQ